MGPGACSPLTRSRGDLELTPKEALYAKARKLAAMTVANGCSEAEAAFAASKLADLLREHNFTMDEATLREEAFVRHRELHEDGVGRRLWKVANGVAHLTGCRYWHNTVARSKNGVEVNFYGFEHEVEVAKYMLAICAHAMRSERDRLYALHKLRDEKTRKRIIVPFLDGMADSLRDRLRAMKPTAPPGKGLVVLKDQLITKAMADAGIKLRTITMAESHDYEGAYTDGVRAGLNVPLNPGLAGALNAKRIA